MEGSDNLKPFLTWDVCDNLLQTPHLLIAGTTGSGKSVLMNSMVCSAIVSGGHILLIDLKRVELRRYKRIVTSMGLVTEPNKVLPYLKHLVGVMEGRYKSMNGVQSEEPHIYVFIDELADLVYTCDKECLDLIAKIGRLGRAANIHLICATQDPSKKTLSAQLMQNFTTRVALRCFSPIESRQIIGVGGAENLPQYGTAIVRDSHGTHKIQVPQTPEDEIRHIVNNLSFPMYYINLLLCAFT